MFTAILKNWSIHGRNGNNAEMVEGAVYEDTLGINVDGSWAKVSNITKVESHETHLMVITGSCKYFLYWKDKAKDVE